VFFTKSAARPVACFGGRHFLFILYTVAPYQGRAPQNEYLFIFEKIRFASQKLNFSIFVFLQKISKNDLK